MIHQDSNKLSDPVLVGGLFAEEADHEIFVVFGVEHDQLVLPVGDAQTGQLHRTQHGKLSGWFSEEYI